MRRSTRQSSKPVFLDLRRTENGYEIIEEKVVNLPPIQKPIMTRPDKPLHHSKSLVTKTGEKVPGTPPSSSYHQGDSFMRSRTTIKPPTGPTKIPYPNGANFPERSPVTRPPGDMIKRDPNPYANMSMPPIRMGHPSEMPGDSYHAHPHQYGQSNVPGMSTEPMYTKPVQKFQKKFPVAIPSCSYWFDMDKIHQIEKESVPEFFQGRPAKTPEVYKRCRNYMINLYRKDPANYLSPTICRKNLGGDACTLMRIHNFLEHWGLINFYIEPSSYPIKSTFLNRINYATEKTQTDLSWDAFESEQDTTALIAKIKNLNKDSKPLCDFCGIICGFTWYQNKSPEQKATPAPEPDTNGTQAPQQTQQETDTKKLLEGKKIILCIECFTKGKFPRLYTQDDFYKVDPFAQGSRTQSSKAWTNEETFRLLGLILTCGDNWTEIQRNFPYRTKEEIIAHYVRLPANNVTSLNLLELGEFKGHEDTGSEKIGDQVPTVFGDFSNPILQHVAIYKSLLTKYRDEKREKQRLAQEALEALEAQKLKETKAEERSDMEVTKLSENVKEEAAEGSMNIEEEIKQNEDEVKIGGSDIVQQTALEIEQEKIEEQNDEKIIEEIIPEVPKTQEQLMREPADRAVELQLDKLKAKLDYLEEFENFLMRERTQQDMIQQSLLAEKIEVAKKRVIPFKQQHPPVYHPTTMPVYEPKEPSYYPFGNQGGGGGFVEEQMDFTEGGFPKEGF